MTEMLMTEANNPTDGATASQNPGDNAATADALYGDGQQSADGQNQQAQDGADAGNAEGDQGDGKGKQSEGAPEKYEFDAGEGKEFDAGVVEAFSEVAKELNLSQADAQKVLDKVAPVIQARQAEQLEGLRNDWVNAAKSDAEFGGEKISENLGIAKKALDSFGSPDLRALLEESGLGNHPEVIRFMFRAGKAISEDSFVGGSPVGGRGSPKDFNSAAAALYNNQQN